MVFSLLDEKISEISNTISLKTQFVGLETTEATFLLPAKDHFEFNGVDSRLPCFSFDIKETIAD